MYVFLSLFKNKIRYDTFPVNFLLIWSILLKYEFVFILQYNGIIYCNIFLILIIYLNNNHNKISSLH